MFSDGHVEMLKSFDKTKMTYHPRKMESWAQVSVN